MPIGGIITTCRHSIDFILEVYSVNFQKDIPLSIFPFVQVFLYQNDPHFRFIQQSLSDFYKNV